MNWFCRVQFIQSHLERERTLPARAAIWSRFNRALSGAGDVGLWKNYFWCALCVGGLRTRGPVAAPGTCGGALLCIFGVTHESTCRFLWSCLAAADDEIVHAV